MMKLKRMLIALLAFSLAFALSIPAYAQFYSGDGESISSAANVDFLLNCNVASTPVNGTALTLYRNTNDPSQRWIYVNVPNTTREYYILSSANQSVALTYTGANAQAVVMTKNSSNSRIQTITLVLESTATGTYSDNGFVWNGQYALTASSLYANGPVKWMSPNGLKTQLWNMQRYPSA